MERNMYRAGGASCTLLQPLLDNQVGLKNMEGVEKVSIPLEKVIRLLSLDVGGVNNVVL